MTQNRIPTSQNGVVQNIEDFDRFVFEPLCHEACRAGDASRPFFAAIDTETTKIDVKRGFNPFYGVRVAMGSISWNTENVVPHDFAWTTRMQPGLLVKPDVPKARRDFPGPLEHLMEGLKGDEAKERLKGLRHELGEARGRWKETGLISEFPEWIQPSLQVEPVENIDPATIVDRLEALTRLGIIWVMKNAKFDLLMFWADGLRVPLSQLEDAEVQSHLTEDQPWQKGRPVSHKLQALAERHLGRKPSAANALEEWFEQMGFAKDNRNYAIAPASILGRYAWQDTRDTLDLFHFFSAKMMKMDRGSRPGKRIADLYRDEMKLIHNLVYDTIIPGLPIDQEKADAAYTKYAGIRDEHGEQLYELTKKNLDWANHHEVAPFLFDDDYPGGLHLRVPEIAMKGKSGRSTDKRVLKELGHAVTDVILDWRSAHYMAENFIGPLARFNHDGIVHPDFWLTTARTGRMSCTHPNMQNRPKDIAIREVFVPRPGYVFMLYDLDQIEMRMAAHYAFRAMQAEPEFWVKLTFRGSSRWVKSTCSEVAMWDGFNSGTSFDPHQRFADETGLPRKREHSGQKTAKEGNFLILYGGGIKKMTTEFGWEYKRAREVRRGWSRAYPEIEHLRHFVTKRIQEAGFISNEYGRRYYIDADKSYLGLNYVIQGVSADLIKRGVNRVFEIKRELREANDGPEPMFIDNIVHDEVITEVREDLVTTALARRVRDSLTTHLRDGTPIFTVPVTAGCEIAEHDWGHPVEYAIEEEGDA